MKTTARTARLVSVLAVTAVSIAALAAATAAWIAQRRPPMPDPMQVQAQRPRADDPVRVVRVPRQDTQRQERTL